MQMRADRGASAVEFGLLLAVLAACIVGAASVAGGGVANLLTSAVSAIAG